MRPLRKIGTVIKYSSRNSNTECLRKFMYVLSNFGISDSFIPNPKIHNYSIAQTDNDITINECACSCNITKNGSQK